MVDVLEGASCRYCGHGVVRLGQRWEAVPFGEVALAGVGLKTAPRPWWWAVCEGCGHASRGQETAP